MKKILLTLAACMCGLFAISQMPAAKAERPANDRMKVPYYNWENTDTVKYFVGAQSYVSGGWKFEPEGGDSKIYEMGLVREGNRVVITNLMDLYVPGFWALNIEIPIEGVYDEAAGTITFDTGIPAAIVQSNRYLGELVAVSEFDANGNIPEGAELSELVMKVSDDFKTITAENFGIRYDGRYFAERFKSFTATKEDPNDPAHISVTYNDIKFPATYVGAPLTHTIAVLNDGGQEADFALKFDGDEGFSSSTIVGTIQPYTMGEIEVIFDPEYPGDFEGTMTIETEDNEPIVMNLSGAAQAVPDYSAIVTNGDFEYMTTIDHPAEIVEFEHPLYDERGEPMLDGEGNPLTETVTAAELNTGGVYGRSDLVVKFTVPDGMIGKFTFDEFVSNPSNQSFNMLSAVCVDDTNMYQKYVQNTCDFPAEYREYEFAPGEHFVLFAHQDANSKRKDIATYIWNINLEITEEIGYGPEIKEDRVFVGYGVVDNDHIFNKSTVVKVRNTGNEEMQILSVTSENPNVQATIPATKAGLFETIEVPVGFYVTTPEDQEAVINIETNVGNVEATIFARIGEYPDYSTLCDENVEAFTFYVDDKYPFVVENGKAYNITSMIDDGIEEMVCSSMKMDVVVPEGQIGYFHFKGHTWGTPLEHYVDNDYWECGGIHCEFPTKVNGANMITWLFYDNDIDVSEDFFSEDDYWQVGDYMTFPEGKTHVEFIYYTPAVKQFWGKQRIEIESFGIRLVDVVGIDGVTSDEECTYEYFNLQGMRLNAPQDGLNIVRRTDKNGNTKAEKVMIKR